MIDSRMTDSKALSGSSLRGLFGMSLITLVMFGVLVSLGVWQLRRKDEKHALIAALSERLANDPVPLPHISQWTSLTPARDEFRRVTLTGSFQPEPEANVFSSGSSLRPDVSGVGAFVFAPFHLASGDATVVIDRGFVADSDRTRVAPITPGHDITLTGYLRFPETAGLLTPKEEQAKRLWFVRDQRAMAAANGWGEVAPFYIDLESPAPPGGLPKPGPLEVHLKDDHLQYAITWFGLALVVTVTFFVWAIGQRRRT
jgi:cytochrome oxidase assembly protein ShyY1